MLGGPGTRRSDRSRVRGTIHQPSGRVRKIRDDVQRACFTWSHAYSRVLAGEYAPPPAFHLLRNAEQRQIVGGADAKVPRLMARFRLLRGVLSWPERVDRHICGTDRRTRWDGSVVKERPHDWRRRAKSSTSVLTVPAKNMRAADTKAVLEVDPQPHPTRPHRLPAARAVP